MKRREIEEDNYDDVLADEGTDDEAQNDAEGNDADEDMVEAVIVTKPSNYNVTVGRTVRLECKVSPDESVVVQWSINNIGHYIVMSKPFDYKIDMTGDKLSVPANSTDLLITDVKSSDGGAYKCELMQNGRPSIVHNLAVLESPRISKFSANDNGQVIEGSDLLLTCEVSGSPPPKIVFSKGAENGNVRLTEKDGEFSLNTVEIKNVKREHSGKYYCYAFNGVGTHQAEVEVVVKGKPHVHVHRTVVNSAINMEAVLQCAVHDEPDAHIRWYKDGQLISSASRQYVVSTSGQHSNLTVTPAVDEDFGTFTCEAENEQGKHNRSIELVQRPVVENLEAEGTKLSWTVHSHQPLQEIEIQIRELTGAGEWYAIQVPVPKERQHEYNLSYALDIDNGKYEATVKVKNDKSWSEHSNTIVVDIEVEPQLIQHASVYRASAHSFVSSSLTILTALIYVFVRIVIESIGHLVKSCLGGGVMAIHESYKHCGLWTSVVLTILLGMFVSYCMLILAQSAQKIYGRVQVPAMSYPDLAEAALETGPFTSLRKYSKCFRYAVDFTICVDLFGSCCVYQIMISRTIKQLVEGTNEISSEGTPPLRVYVACLVIPCVLICMITTLKYLAPFSIVADVFIVTCAGATIYYAVKTATISPVDFPVFKTVPGLFEFMGVCVFSMEGVGVTLAIENSMAEPKKIPIVLVGGMSIVVSIVLTVGFFGYWGFGEKSKSPVTLNFPLEPFPIALKVLMAFMIYVTFALNFWVPFDLVWFYIKQRYDASKYWLWERVYRAIFVIIITIIAVIFPAVTKFIGLLGSFCLSNMGFIYPAFIELCLDWNDPGLGIMRWRLWKFVVILIFGTILCIVGTYSNAKELISEVF
ncbi:unnamed protein product, partial [Brenthis ino]